MVGDGEMHGALKDSAGDNISQLNSSFCELTALYWIWKNSDANVIGMVHYRRYFKGAIFKKEPIREEAITKLLYKYDILVSKKRNYLVVNVFNHYKKSHNIEDLLMAREIVERMHPDYIESFDKVLSGKVLSLYNMLITRKELLDKYCEWLFPILFELSSKSNISEYNSYQSRMIGFVAERLFNVWITKNSEFKVKEIGVYNTDGFGGLPKIYSFVRKILS